MKRETTDLHMSAHFGLAHDALGYQQPPRSMRAAPPAPAHTMALRNVIDDLRAHLSANLSISDSTYNAVESALMAATTANRICYYCHQPGHIASTCPLKQQHRQQHGGTRQGWQQTRPGYQQAPTTNQNAPTASRDVVPNRPTLPPRPMVSPAPPQRQVAQTAHCCCKKEKKMQY